MSNLVVQGLTILANPKPYVFGLAIGVPLLITVVSASTDVLLREEVKQGKLTTAFLYKSLRPSDTLRAMLSLSKIFLLGVFLAPFLSFPERILCLLVLVGVSLFTGFLD